MRTRPLVTRVVVPVATAAALATSGITLLGAGRGAPAVARTDFATAPRSTTPVYQAALAPAGKAPVKEFRIPITDATIQIADGVTYQGWTFGGTVPGPVIRARVGDRVKVTVVNETPMPHSIDFHAARIPPDVAYRTIMPKDSVSFEFTPHDPGAFLVHCGTPPVTMHLMEGMYFPMIVDPKDGWGTTADKEFVLVQSEFYAQPSAAAHEHEEHAGKTGDDADHGPAASKPMQADWQAAMAKQASYVVFNGRAFQYKAHPFQVDVGDRVRLFVVNAGPSFTSDFHIVGAIFNRVYPDGDPAHALHGVQTYPVPAGGGVVFETVFDADGSGAGTYAFVTHSFADAEKGAVGMIRVGPAAQVAAIH